MIILIFFIAHWYLSLFTQTFYNHRYAAHQMFTMNKGWEKFFYILAYLFQGSSFLSPRVYGILHRMHHAYADTEKDPHSPKFTHNFFKMMAQTRTIYLDILRNRMTIEPRFLKNIPTWSFMEKIGESRISRVIWSLGYIAFYVAFATQWWMFLLLPIHIVMGPVHGAIINWFAHKFGYINFKVNDTAKNFLPVDFLMLGESYHNNHHKFGGRANFGVRWHEIDPVYPFIYLFHKLGIIKLKVNNDLNYM